ncbi:hypothetical protein [Enterobacter asburiae]|uniref:hypothetical protein n=1 Tax=Enterobacter asburiae TaxID=61645 RepID=UPI003BDBD164
MSTITREFTKEQLIEHAKKHIAHDVWLRNKFGETHNTPATVELARIALASLEAEPMAYWRHAYRADGFCYADGINSKKYHEANPLSQLSDGDYWQVTPLYTAPPAPVAPYASREQFEQWMLNQWGRDRGSHDFFMVPTISGQDYSDSYTRCMWKAWNACRAAMLNGGKQ